MEGYVKLHRSIVDSTVFQDAEVLKLWIWLLCNVAYADHDVLINGKIITVKTGQVITGRKKLGEQLNLSENKVYRALSILQKLGNVNIKTNNRYSVVTVTKWAKYQSDNQNVNNTVTTQQQHSNNTATTQQQHSNTTKESKERKERKERKEVVVSTDTASPTTTSEQDLISLYGIEATERYKKRFETWAKKKDAKVECIPTIAEWMKKDKVPKKSAEVMSSFKSEVIDEEILAQYGV